MISTNLRSTGSPAGGLAQRPQRHPRVVARRALRCWTSYHALGLEVPDPPLDRRRTAGGAGGGAGVVAGGCDGGPGQQEGSRDQNCRKPVGAID